MKTDSPSGYSADEILCGRTSGNCATYTAYGCDCRAASGCKGFVCIKNPTGDFTANESICGVTSSASYATWSGFEASSIIQCGLYTKVLADNTAINKHMLDRVAEKILLSKRLPTLKVSINPEDPIAAWTNIDLGDMITIADGEVIGLSENEEVRVTGFEYYFGFEGEGLILYCNDTTVRNYASIETNYVDEKEMTEQPKQQSQLRDYDRVCMSSCCGSDSNCYLGMKQLKYVACPIDDFDAANKTYVDGAAGGGAHWCCDIIGALPVLHPCYADYSLTPNGTVAAVGLSTCPWIAGRFGNTERYLKVAKDVGAACIEANGTDTNIGMNFKLKGSSSFLYEMCGDAGDYEQYWLKVCSATIAGDVGCSGKVVFEATGDVYNDVDMDFVPGGAGDAAVRVCGNLEPLNTAFVADRCFGTCDKPWLKTYAHTYCACCMFTGKCAIATTCIRSPIICSTATMLANGCVCAPYGLFPCVCTCCRFKLPVGNNMYG